MQSFRSVLVPALLAFALCASAASLAGCSDGGVAHAGDAPGTVPDTATGDAPASDASPFLERPSAPVLPSGPKADEGVLQARVDAIVARWVDEAVRRSKGRATATDVHVGLVALDLERGTVFAQREARRSMVPASNMKLVTTAAAMVGLGPEGELVTRFTTTGRVSGGVLAGDLVVHGAGDPLWHPEARGGDRLTDVFRQLRRDGIERIEGNVVLDTGTFDEPAPGPGWPSENQHWDDYCALAGAFSVHGGVLRAEVVPGASGSPAAIDVRPWPTGLEPRLGVTTKNGSKLDVRVGATATRLTVTGSMPPSRTPWVTEFRHPDPIGLFANVLVDRLRAAGVTLTGQVVRTRGVEAGRVLHELRTPVVELLTPINADSVNGVADQLFFATGHRLLGDGSRAGAARAVEKLLVRLGVPTEGWVQRDGSGLSREDRITPWQLAMVLVAVLARDPETSNAYRDSLALAGRRGTLEDRMRDGPAAGRAWGKTGWIRGTSALSGLAVTPRGREVVFSILVEYPPALSGLNTHVFKPMQDELVELFVEATP